MQYFNLLKVLTFEREVRCAKYHVSSGLMISKTVDATQYDKDTIYSSNTACAWSGIYLTEFA